MSSLQQPSLFISFTNNAQRAQLLPPGGFPQSLSGSETDISTSNENLSHEERYVIRHTARQEPQGQENLSSNRSSLDVSTSSYNTLIIHGAGDEPWTGRLSGIRDFQETGPASPSYLAYSSGDNAKMGSHSPSPGTSKETSNRKSYDASSNRLFDPNGRDITDIPDDYLNQSQVLKHLAKEAKVAPASSSSPGPSDSQSSPPQRERSESSNSGYTQNGSVPDHFKRLSLSSSSPANDSAPAEECVYAADDLPPPPQYGVRLLPRLAADKLSRSQPDLSRVGARRVATASGSVTSPRPKTNGREDLDPAQHDIWPPAEMVEILIQENSALKLELETCYQKVAKSQKLENEIGKIHRAHEDMVSSSERRARLERTARGRLESDCRRLADANRVLREQADALAAQLRGGGQEPDGLRKELTKRELLIAQLITQNKELLAARDRQEIELAAQRATLQEQRTHIDILDTALTNAQGNVVRLEEECRKKQTYVERVAQLQRALASLQLASDRREQTERKLRLQLERELRGERARGSTATDSAAESAPELKRQLREREEKIMRLEGDVTKWEQRYLEESALRQAAIDAASIPKDAKIAALEKTSQETEKLIADARAEKIRHMDEVHASQKKVSDLESRLKEQESKLAERDAMIRVLQKHTYDKDMSATTSSSSYLGRSPHHTPHPSDIGTVRGSREQLDPVSTTSVFSSASSVLTSSYAGTDSYTTLSRAKYAANKSFHDTNKSLDDQLKELDSQLDSQLLSKRALCCFPGFSNSSAASRKGKVPQPLLAGVGVGGFEAGFLQGLVPRYEQARPEEMLLLEKQGRCSQQQRMQECVGSRTRAGSLPPTSLPRPLRTRPPGVRAAGYGRLSDGEGRKKALEDMAAPGGRGDESHAAARFDRPVQIRPPAPRRPGEYARLSDGDGRKTPGDSRIPAPRRLGEYGRLSGGSVEKAGSRAGSSVKSGGRDSSSEDLGSQAKLLPRARSLSRDAGKADDTQSNASSGKYRIQF